MATYAISDTDLGRMKAEISKRDAAITRSESRREKETAVNKALAVGEATLGMFGLGYLRGKLEDPSTGAWNVPGTTIDWEILGFLGLLGVAFGGQYQKDLAPYANHAAFLAAGIGGHYAGQIGRKMGRTGQFTRVAGVPGIGALPQWSPTSYDPTQFSAPYDDQAAAALASSGV